MSWITSLADLTVEAGLVSISEIENQQADGVQTMGRNPIDAEGVSRLIAYGRPTSRPMDAPARFVTRPCPRHQRQSAGTYTPAALCPW